MSSYRSYYPKEFISKVLSRFFIASDLTNYTGHRIPESRIAKPPLRLHRRMSQLHYIHHHLRHLLKDAALLAQPLMYRKLHLLQSLFALLMCGAVLEVAMKKRFRKVRMRLLIFPKNIHVLIYRAFHRSDGVGASRSSAYRRSQGRTRRAAA